MKSYLSIILAVVLVTAAAKIVEVKDSKDGKHHLSLIHFSDRLLPLLNRSPPRLPLQPERPHYR